MRSAAKKFVRELRQIATVGRLGKEDQRGWPQIFSAVCGKVARLPPKSPARALANWHTCQ